MNSILANASDEEAMMQFATAFANNDFAQIGRLMADYNALQRPDGDKLKSALQPKGNFLMGGEAEALEAHQDTRASIGLMLEWTTQLAQYDVQESNPQPKIVAAWSSIAAFFLKKKDFQGLRSLIDFLKSDEAQEAQTGMAGMLGSPEQLEAAKEFMVEFMPIPRELVFGKEEEKPE
ncbi:hypothetical protein Q5H93_02860 [Hymenobacter sp. ASUV-10]|uniref:Uncharacterized protein n=1 Tax=Hymenobacter aranciens TaxID=3063996 RepID=A0ABT9B5W2_9BACT|nr:hypothetical protein [Hymenobacter sp. ASUV-10]MDO7873659.1 hypothetical protein [Hymenobacter sp. ASUV-10]